MSVNDKLDDATAMGALTLRVADLDGMIRYYTQAVPLQLQSHKGDTAVLGRGGIPSIVLQHSPELRPASPHAAGLFHTAIVFDTQRDLARAVYSVARHAPNTFAGSADHLVSQAFYFTDPEGNGVELYWDRDRTAWSWTHGQVEMATLYLDPNAFLADHLGEDEGTPVLAGGAHIGHVHLSVGDVASAREFYVDRLGFDATAAMGDQALFVSAGGYHHHMAMNVWNSRGAGRRAPALGLGEVKIVLPAGDGLAELGERMRHYRVPLADDGVGLSFEDPWANAVRVVASPA